jgi:hypothetical protein
MNSHDPDIDNPFISMWRNGYRSILPILPPKAVLSATSDIPPDKLGKNPGKWTEHGWVGFKGWPHHVTQESDLREWHRWKAGIGLRADSGILGIDTDAVVESDAAIIQRAVAETLGDLPKRVGQAPKALFVCRTDPDYRHPKILFRESAQIDLFAGRRQFVVRGIHPKTMRDYTWPTRLVPFDKLPVFDPALITSFMARLLEELPDAKLTGLKTEPGEPPPPQEALRGAPALITEAMRHIPNDYVDRDPYIWMAAALKASLPDDLDLAWKLFWEWCEDWERGEDINEESVARKDFDSLKPPFKLGVDYVCKLAELRSGGAFKASDRWAEEILDSGRDEVPETSPPRGALEGTPYGFPDPSSIEPEDFLYGTWLVRDYVTLISAQTKVGKSLLMIAVALAMASGKPLLGVKTLRPLRVRLWNGEDTVATMSRRIAAAMRHYGLTREDIGDRLLVDSGRNQPIVVGIQAKSGAEIKAPVVEGLLLALQKQKVDVLVIDPFIKAHKVSENDNAAIDAIAQEWVRIADKAHVGVVLVHHSRKMNGNEASVDDSRGASALPSAARATLVLARMTKKDATETGKLKEYKSLFRIADAASNLAAAPGDDEQWFEITSVDLGNGRFAEDGSLLKRSDRIGVARLYKPLDIPQDGDERLEQEKTALTELSSGSWRKDKNAKDAWGGVVIGRAFHIDIGEPEGAAQVKAIIARWLREGKLGEETRHDHRRNKRTFLTRVKPVGNKLFFD